MMAVAAIGILVNAVTAWLFASGRKDDINLRGAFLHMAADAVVSVGVVAAGLVILLTLALARSGRQPRHQRGHRMGHLGPSARFRRHVDGGGPPANRSRGGAAAPSARAGVVDVHDLHIWPMSTTENALTCHLVMPDGHPGDAFLIELCSDLAERFKINHTTVQIEVDPHIACALAPDEVV